MGESMMLGGGVGRSHAERLWASTTFPSTAKYYLRPNGSWLMLMISFKFPLICFLLSHSQLSKSGSKVTIGGKGLCVSRMISELLKRPQNFWCQGDGAYLSLLNMLWFQIKKETKGIFVIINPSSRNFGASYNFHMVQFEPLWPWWVHMTHQYCHIGFVQSKKKSHIGMLGYSVSNSFVSDDTWSRPKGYPKFS